MLDEPLGALDRALRDRLVAELRALFVRLGLTILFVTHDHDEAFALADRVVVMHDGPDRAVRQPGRGLAPTGERVRRPLPRLERHPGASATAASRCAPGAIRVVDGRRGHRRRDRAHLPARALPPRRRVDGRDPPEILQVEVPLDAHAASPTSATRVTLGARTPGATRSPLD